MRKGGSLLEGEGVQHALIRVVLQAFKIGYLVPYMDRLKRLANDASLRTELAAFPAALDAQEPVLPEHRPGSTPCQALMLVFCTFSPRSALPLRSRHSVHALAANIPNPLRRQEFGPPERCLLHTTHKTYVAHLREFFLTMWACAIPAIEPCFPQVRPLLLSVLFSSFLSPTVCVPLVQLSSLHSYAVSTKNQSPPKGFLLRPPLHSPPLSSSARCSAISPLSPPSSLLPFLSSLSLSSPPTGTA